MLEALPKTNTFIERTSPLNAARHYLDIQIKNTEKVLENEALKNHPRYQEARALLRQAGLVLQAIGAGGTTSIQVLENLRMNLQFLDEEMQNWQPNASSIGGSILRTLQQLLHH